MTILYSDLIAGLLGQLRHVKNWNADVVSPPTARRAGGSCDRARRCRAPPVLMTDSGGLAAAHTGSWLTAAARRIATGNQPGNLDGLFARHVLADTAVTGLNWDVSPLSPQWLEDNRERLAYAPVMAALGYGLAHTAPPGQGQATARAALATGLPRLMARDPFRIG